MDNFKTGISNLYEYTSCDWMKLLCQNQQQIFNYKGRWKEKDFVLELFRPKLHTPTQTLCNTPSPLLWDTSVNTVYTTQWALGFWIFFVHYLHMWLSVKIFMQSINVWCALGVLFCSILSFYQCGCVSHSKHIYMGTCMKLLLLIKFFIFIIFFRKRLTTKQILASMNTAMWLVTLQNLKRMRQLSQWPIQHWT